jgi:tetratricopeptide (TPR) repeat protein
VDASARERLSSVIESSDAVLAEDGESPDPVASRRVAEALLRKGQALRKLGRFEDAVAVWDDLVARFGEEPAAPLIALHAWLSKARDLNRVGRHREAVDAVSVLLKLCERRDETDAAQLMVARALDVKARALVFMGCFDDAVACDEEMISRFGQAPETEFRHWVASALEREARVLIREGRVDDAVAVSQQLVDRFAGESVESLPAVAEIISDHIMFLLKAGSPDLSGVLRFLVVVLVNATGEAISATAAMVMRHRVLPTPISRSQRLLGIEQSIIPQSLVHQRVRARQALYVSRALLARIGTTDDPDLRQYAAMAQFSAAVGLILLGHLRVGFAAINRLTEKGDPDTIQAFKRLAGRFQRSKSVVDQLGTISLLSLRAEMLGDGDPDLTKIAYDDSIASHRDISPHTGIIPWVANQLRPTTKHKPPDRPRG